MDFWKAVSPSLPREELTSEAQHLPGTRGGGALPLQLASRVPGPVVMEEERGCKWTCARDPPRKQTEPSEGSLGRIRKRGLYTVVGCEAAGTSGSWEPQPPRRRGGAGRGSVTGPQGAGQRGLRPSWSSLSARSPAGAPIVSPMGTPGWVAAVTWLCHAGYRAGWGVGCRPQSVSCWDSAGFWGALAWTPRPLGTFFSVCEARTQ